MPEYRIYTIGSDGHFYSSIPLVCADDAEAMKQAMSWSRLSEQNLRADKWSVCRG
jgi:hypothetical protein